MLQEMKNHPQLIFEAKQVIQETGVSEEEQEHMEQLKEEIKQHYHNLYEKVEENKDSEDFGINSTEIKDDCWWNLAETVHLL